MMDGTESMRRRDEGMGERLVFGVILGFAMSFISHPSTSRTLLCCP